MAEMELKPCPFCESAMGIRYATVTKEPIYAQHPKGVECYFSGIGFGVDTWQWKLWNQRSEAKVRALEELLKEYRNVTRNHKTLCVSEKYYPDLGIMDDRCDLCKRADSLLAERTKENKLDA